MPEPSRLEQQIDLDVPAEEAFAWHQRPGAVERVLPPFIRASIVHVDERFRALEEGGRLSVKRPWGPFRFVIEGVLVDCDPPRQFGVEVGPADKPWYRMRLRFEPRDEGRRCRLHLDIELLHLGGLIGRLCRTRSHLVRQLEREVAYRRELLPAELAMHARYADRPRLTVAISGASGLIGRNLAAVLASGGHRVIRLVRRAQPDTPDAVLWQPESGIADTAPLEGIDAVVHLAGENIAARRWTRSQMARLRHSRIAATQNLSESLKRMNAPPRVMIGASAIGIYGDRGEQWLDEDSEPGEGFLAEVGREWEAAARLMETVGTRVVNARLGVVLTPEGGALRKMLPAFRLGLGGPLGSGRQWQSWVGIDDCLAAMLHMLMSDELSGPVNVVAPEPVRQRDFARTLGRVLGRPAFLPAPAFALRLMLGRLADEALLASARVRSAKLTEAGLPFRHHALEAALRHLLGRVM